MFSLFHLYVFLLCFKKNCSFAKKNKKKQRPRLAVTAHAAGQSLSAHAALLLFFSIFSSLRICLVPHCVSMDH